LSNYNVRKCESYLTLGIDKKSFLWTIAAQIFTGTTTLGKVYMEKPSSKNSNGKSEIFEKTLSKASEKLKIQKTKDKNL